MAKKDTPQEIVVDDDIKDKPTKDDASKDSVALEIDIDKKAEKKEEKSEPKYVTVDELEKIRKANNALQYSNRKLETKIEELTEVLRSSGSSRAEKKEAKDELDELVESGDWKTAVRKLATEEAHNILKSRDEELTTERKRQEVHGRLEASKTRVLDKYPDLNDPDSELSRRYIKIKNEYPHFLRNEMGPELAMYKMEEELRTEGRFDEYTKKAVEKEVLRQARAGASQVGRSTAATNGKVVLTKEMKEACDANGWNYEDYAKMVNQLQKNSQVEA